MKNTIYSIQVLRGIAALLVVIFHSYIHLEARNLIPKVPGLADVGRAGVDIFFVISGFIMVCISGESFGYRRGAQDFLIKRIIRVVPIYWIYTLLMAAFLFSVPHLFSSGKMFSLAHLMASLLFIPWENGVGYIKPILGLGWTLNFEMYFYVVFAGLLFFSQRFFLPLLSTILLSGFLAGLLFAPVPAIFDVITSPMLFEFLMGCVIATLYMRREVVLPGYLCIILLLAGVILIILTGIFELDGISRVIIWGIPAATIVLGAVYLEKSRSINFPPLLTMLGNSSYSLYLTHLFTINAIGKIWELVFGRMYDVFIIVVTLSSMVAGYLAYLVVEKPLTSYLNKLYATWKIRTSERDGMPVPVPD